MAYEGKYIDRSPCLRAAGQVRYKRDQNVAATLVHEVNDNEVSHKVYKTVPLHFNLPPKRVNIYKGFYSDARECLQPEQDKSFFDVLKKEFQETVYKSYWKKELGRLPDPSPMLPAGMDHTKVCFGKSTRSLTTAGEVVNPPKSYVDVMEDACAAHDMYRKSHNDYDPGEGVQRNYVEPYSKDVRYGMKAPVSARECCLKKVMNSESNEKILISRVLADYKKRTALAIGKVHEPNKNIDCVPLGHAFGKEIKRGVYGAGELLKDCAPSLDKVNLHEELSYINKLRRNIAKRHTPFSHRDFVEEFHRLKPDTNFISIQETYSLLNKFGVYPDRDMFERVLQRLKYLNSDNFFLFDKLTGLIDINVLFPDLGKLEDVPTEFLNYQTDSRDAQTYHQWSDDMKAGTGFQKAGLPSKEHTPMKSVISPAIYMHYFLEPEDFFVSRSSEYLQNLLNRTDHELSQDKFDLAWNEAQDNDGCVSVNSFLKAVNRAECKKIY